MIARVYIRMEDGGLACRRSQLFIIVRKRCVHIRPYIDIREAERYAAQHAPQYKGQHEHKYFADVTLGDPFTFVQRLARRHFGVFRQDKIGH